MKQTRRDFFGVIAAPLFRRFAPPVPLAQGGFVRNFGTIFAPARNRLGPPLSVESLRKALRVLEQDAPPLFQPTVMIIKPGMEDLARKVLNAR